jgi:hypothetical protein
VTFDGINCFARDEQSYSRRALVIQGNFFTKRHTPVLGVHNANKASLERASGRYVECDQTYCWTRIAGLAMRVIGDRLDPSPITIEDRSFKDLVPRLQTLVPSDFDDELMNVELPGRPVKGFFDIVGGTLYAFPFKSFKQGVFVYPDQTMCEPRQFADTVAWRGWRYGPARLQIKSRATDHRWVTVEMDRYDQPLRIAVVNVGHAHHTSSHFALNEKLYYDLEGHLPKILVDGVPDCDYTKKRCYTSSLMSLIDVPGCSNSQFP